MFNKWGVKAPHYLILIEAKMKELSFIYRVAKKFKLDGKFYNYRDVIELPYVKAKPIMRSGKIIKIADQEGAKKLLPKKEVVKKAVKKPAENIAEIVFSKKPKYNKRGVKANVQK